MNRTVKIGVLSAAFFALGVATAAASTQDDIQSCREALTVKGDLQMEDYRLSFKRKKGNSNRTLTLEAIPNKGGEKFIVSCTFSRNDVTEVIVTQA